MYARRCARHDAPQRAEPERLGLLACRDQERRRTVVDPGRVARRDGPALLECRLELSELVDGAARARVLVLAHQICAVVHGLDLAREAAVGLPASVAILAARGVAALFRAAC